MIGSRPWSSKRGTLASRAAVNSLLFALAGCAGNSAAPVAPLAPVGAALVARGPLEAAFVDVPARFEASRCARVIVAAARGAVTVAGERLAEGDSLVMARPGPFGLSGSGLVLVARVPLRACEGEATKTVVPAGRAEELTWAEGRMHAHLDVGTDLSPEAYLGRLSGSAPVAEHTHPEQWEILAAVEAAGTFTVNGVPHRLGAGEILAVPPGTRHSWQPDPGSTLVAVQIYDPPGPEQRFVGLAKAAAAQSASPAKR